MKKLFLVLFATCSLNSFAQAECANPKNPVDHVGRLHNVLVQQFLNQFGGTTLPTTQVAAEIQKLADKNAEISKLKGTNARPVDIKIIDKGKADFPNQFKNVVSGLNMSQAAKTEVQKLIDYHFTLAFKSQKTSYQDYYNYIVNFENAILSNSNIVAPDKYAILAGTSTARYSVHFWERKYASKEYTGGGGGLTFWDYVLVGICDVGGGISGYVSSGGNLYTTINQASTTSVSTHDTIKGKRD